MPRRMLDVRFDETHLPGETGYMTGAPLPILGAHERNGEEGLATTKLGQFLTARYDTVGEAKNRLGGLLQIKAAFDQMQARRYAS